MLKSLRKWHKWPGIILTFFILVFAVSGIILNHRELFSSLDVNRKYLPKNYSWNNWNLGAVKGSACMGYDSILVYGNIGVWVTNEGFTHFEDFNKGFPEGIDNRKISSLAVTADGRIFAGTLFGLYQYRSGLWKIVNMPVEEKRVVKVLEKGDSLLVMTRSNLIIGDLKAKDLSLRITGLPAPADDDHKTGLFRTLWVIHSGEIYGFTGKILIDFVGFVFIIICITGLIWFFMPVFIKRIKNKFRSPLKKFNRDSLRVHNWLGSWLLPFLLLTTLTGMFLRPPLLIPIANSKVKKIKFSELDSPNPWFDRFRDLLYDRQKHLFYFATNEGIYYSTEGLNKLLTPCEVQPPVSVMGITAFEQADDGSVIVGSFSGIYKWNPESPDIFDHFTGMRYVETGQSGPPFGNVSVSGYIRVRDKEYIFDYAAGAIGLGKSGSFAAMPSNIIKKSPVSLWNAALEIHTGRIYEPITGKFYILIVPLVGIFTLIIIVTGFFSWLLARKKKRAALLLRMES